jgi:hypothetical protein
LKLAFAPYAIFNPTSSAERNAPVPMIDPGTSAPAVSGAPKLEHK